MSVGVDDFHVYSLFREPDVASPRPRCGRLSDDGDTKRYRIGNGRSIQSEVIGVVSAIRPQETPAWIGEGGSSEPFGSRRRKSGGPSDGSPGIEIDCSWTAAAVNPFRSRCLESPESSESWSRMGQLNAPGRSVVARGVSTFFRTSSALTTTARLVVNARRSQWVD